MTFIINNQISRLIYHNNQCYEIEVTVASELDVNKLPEAFCKMVDNVFVGIIATLASTEKYQGALASEGGVQLQLGKSKDPAASTLTYIDPADKTKRQTEFLNTIAVTKKVFNQATVSFKQLKSYYHPPQTDASDDAHYATMKDLADQLCHSVFKSRFVVGIQQKH